MRKRKRRGEGELRGRSEERGWRRDVRGEGGGRRKEEGEVSEVWEERGDRKICEFFFLMM